MEVPIERATRLISPRLTVLVTSFSRDRKPNAAPFSWVGCVSFVPPMVQIGVMKQNKGTLSNIRESGKFGINIVSEDWGQKAVDCESRSDSRLKKAGIEVDSNGKVPEARSFMQCRLTDVLEPKGADHVLVVGEVVRAECDFWDEKNKRTDIDRVRPLMHGSGSHFRTVGRRIELERGR